MVAPETKEDNMSEVLEVTDKPLRNHDDFFRVVESIARDAMPKALDLRLSEASTDHGDRCVRFQFGDDLWIEVSASQTGWSIRRSDLAHFAEPWRPIPARFVRRPITGFFAKKKKNK
jgi:hypothetical protein